MIVLTAEQAAQLLYKDQFADAILRPLPLTDGTYAVPETALTDPRHARWWSILKQGSIVSSGSLTFSSDRQTFYIPVDEHNMFLYLSSHPELFGYPAPSIFDLPADDLYRFEIRYNPDVGSLDSSHDNRRVELMQPDADGYVAGQTLWASWSTIFNDQRDGFQGTYSTIIHQWHQDRTSVNVYPFLTVVLRDGGLEIGTRSSIDGGTFHTHYYEPFEPPSGIPTHFVLSGLLGNPGHLNGWLNGEQIINVDIPIGYYAESPLPPKLAIIQFGAYMPNVRSVDVIYHANMEFGTTDLTSRIAAPLAINVPDDGFGDATTYPTSDPYPATDLYPATNLYPEG